MATDERVQELMNQLLSVDQKNKAKVINLIRHEVMDGDGRYDFFEVEKKLNTEFENPKNAIDPSQLQPIKEYINSIKRNFRTVVMVLDQTKIRSNDKDSETIVVAATPLKSRNVSLNFPLCKGIAYGNQLSAHSTGSGFFVDKNIVATAAHVVMRPGVEFADIRFIHGILMSESGDFYPEIIVRKSQVFKPVYPELQANQYYLSETGSDFAIIPVQPAYDGVDAVAVESVEFPKDIKAYNELFQNQEIKEKEVYSIGHGLGLPLKFSYEGKVSHAPRTFPYFECNLTLLGGNSGSPIFDAHNHELLGIFIRGSKKLELTGSGHCLDVKKEIQTGNNGEADGQECQRLEFVYKALELAKNR